MSSAPTPSAPVPPLVTTGATATFHAALQEFRREGLGLCVLPGGAHAQIHQPPPDAFTGPPLPEHKLHALVQSWHFSQRKCIDALLRMPGVKIVVLPGLLKMGSRSPEALALGYALWRHTGAPGLGAEMAEALKALKWTDGSLWMEVAGKALRFGMYPPDPGHDTLGWKRWVAAILYTPLEVSQFAGMGVAIPSLGWTANIGGFLEHPDPVSLFNKTYMHRGRVFGEEGDAPEVDAMFQDWTRKRSMGLPTTLRPEGVPVGGIYPSDSSSGGSTSGS